MKVSGFSYIRNGFKYDYPFREAIRSILPVCDEFVVAVGESDDGTRAAVQALAPDKIRIVDTVWDDALREGGHIFAHQANTAFDAVRGDWAFHIQADEVVHERYLDHIHAMMKRHLHDAKVEGFVFPFRHFYGDYRHFASSRDWYRREVRIVRNDKRIRSYRDSQGFRMYPNRVTPSRGHRGRKLRCKLIEAPFFHYSYVKPPDLQLKKQKVFNSYWHDDDWVAREFAGESTYDYYGRVDEVSRFEGSHPAVMLERIGNQNWTFHPGKVHGARNLKKIVLGFIEKHTGWRIGEYRNYRLV